MHQLDESFKQAKALRAKRKRRGLIRRLIIIGASVSVLAAGALVAVLQPQLWQGWFGATPDEGGVPVADSGGEPAVYVPAIVDLAGDPMKISLGDDLGLSQVTRFMPRPDSVPTERVVTDVAVLSDVMITTSQRFMTTLPSSPKDFALYQSQRTVALPPPPRPEDGAPPLPEDGSSPSGSDDGGPPPRPDDGAGSPTIDEGGQPPPVLDTTSVAYVMPETRRFQPESEYVGKILQPRSLEDLMRETHYAPEDAAVFAEAMLRLLERDELQVGDVVAIHGIRADAGSPTLRPVQLSLYNGGAYLGTLTRADSGAVVLGADPWVYDSLFNYSGQEEVAQPGRQYRLLDAVYSTAVRNRVPTGVLGEAIMLLSRRFDLNAFATTKDRLVLAYARDGLGDEGGIGRVLYASIDGDDRNMQCYVFKMQTEGDYSCFAQGRPGAAMASPTGGMVNPVRGILTTPFGPGMDPVLKKVTVQSGVTWTAPLRTPVVAAFAGTVISASPDGDAGNLVRLSHSGGRETRYAHLDAFAPGVTAGRTVAAGELIGYVGTSGKTAGPMLQFELHVGGKAVDPLGTTAAVTTDDTAVEQLTDRIVHVESGGNATAKNPLSSAFGLGQFINSTWIRMMATYRPDLSRSMSQEDLLALRADPTIAREMVSNLAREGESYLRSRGHQITAGRLYLCHFLGMEGADIVLSADPTADLAAVLGAGVISANPFLTGQNAAYVIDWAERKMSGRRGAPPPPPVPPEFRIYQAAIDALLTPPTMDVASN